MVGVHAPVSWRQRDTRASEKRPAIDIGFGPAAGMVKVSSAMFTLVARAPRPLEPLPELRGEDSARLVLVEKDATPEEILYARVAPVVNRVVWTYLAADAERDDIAQEIFLAIVRGAGTLKDPTRLEAWASRVAVNAIWNVFRRRKLRRWLSLESVENAEPSIHHADFEGRELVLRTRRILEMLPLKQRMPFTLKLLGNASVEEIAEKCGCSPRTVKRRLTDARARFIRLAERDPALANLLGDATESTEDDDG
jgi:RNA polymerase sigma factor (sigma-70 family)